jgi:hypothetical protein
MGLLVRGFFLPIGVIALIQSAAIFFGGFAQGTEPGVILALFGLCFPFCGRCASPSGRRKRPPAAVPGVADVSA